MESTNSLVPAIKRLFLKSCLLSDGGLVRVGQTTQSCEDVPEPVMRTARGVGPVVAAINAVRVFFWSGPSKSGAGLRGIHAPVLRRRLSQSAILRIRPTNGTQDLPRGGA